MPQKASATFPARRPFQTARGLKAFWPLCQAHPPLAVCTAKCCSDRFLPLCRLLPMDGTLGSLGLGQGTSILGLGPGLNPGLEHNWEGTCFGATWSWHPSRGGRDLSGVLLLPRGLEAMVCGFCRKKAGGQESAHGCPCPQGPLDFDEVSSL
jgi:hypothetical protein